MAAESETTTPLLTTVLDQIGTDIVSGTLEAGRRLRLQDICERFDISRTVAREAMRALEQLGMVSSGRRVGITVLPIEHWSVFDPAVITWRLSCEKSRAAQRDSLNQLRLAVEPNAARLAALNATEEQKAQILAVAQRLAELEATPSTKVGEELATDLHFHTLIFEASGNEMFAALAPPCWPCSRASPSSAPPSAIPLPGPQPCTSRSRAPSRRATPKTQKSWTGSFSSKPDPAFSFKQRSPRD
ncbi:FadR/GntR family transcriptional regulator [Corynebacterium sp.]|uniref:FadR/GntR family transcriptional regulator n=1 Tax=Corynebacterium sp. TaxID=1720 RepID=UPI0034C65FF8